MKKMTSRDPSSEPPSFARRAAATWVDFVLLLGFYLILGALSEYLFQKEAYPPPKAMQIYLQREFDILVFFAISTIILTSAYLFVGYRCFGATFGQCLAEIRVRNLQGVPPSTVQILSRIAFVLLRLFLVLVPGPLAAIGFVFLGAQLLNAAFSMALLAAALLGIFYCSIARYRSGHTTSATDYLTGTRLVDIGAPRVRPKEKP